MTDRKPVTCKRCGCPNLRWAMSKKGNWYLTPMEGKQIRGENGRVIKVLALGHRCDAYLEREAQYAADEARHMERMRERGLIG